MEWIVWWSDIAINDYGLVSKGGESLSFIDTIQSQPHDAAKHCTTLLCYHPLNSGHTVKYSSSSLSLLTGSVPRIDSETEEEDGRIQSDSGENPSA
jgi:hypothetical protein